MIVSPRRANWSRWYRLSSARYSVLRSLEYEAIQGLKLKGKTLDIGGGKNISYRHLIEIDGHVDSVNIDPQIEPTMLADLNQPLPIPDASYDNVLSLNTFEHIKHDTTAVSEMLRVLKPGGEFHVMVPFLYREHGSPFDFHRHTSFWWEEFLVARGAAPDTLVLEPLMFDVLSSAYSLVEFYLPLRTVIKRGVMFVGTLLQTLRTPAGVRMSEAKGRSFQVYALGYYIHGRKRTES